MTEDRCDVIIKTWWNDLAFLSYALRFLEKNWQQPDSKIIVLANRNCSPVLESWGFPRDRFIYRYVDPWPDGNQFQCYLTLLADHFSDAEMFAFFDSDTMLVRPMTVNSRTWCGDPIIYAEPGSPDLSEDRALAHKLWFPIMKYWVGLEPQADYMFAFPFIYWADTLRAVRRLITNKTGQGLLESLYSSVPFHPANFVTHPFRFCEHNVISFWAATHELDRYHVRAIGEITEEERAHWPVKSYHSWTQWNTQTQCELESLLLATT